jgi:hypothetical protein
MPGLRITITTKGRATTAEKRQQAVSATQIYSEKSNPTFQRLTDLKASEAHKKEATRPFSVYQT